MFEFEAKLVRPDANGSWTYLNVPLDTEEIFETKSRVQVKGSVNGIPYRGTLMPHGNGKHFMVVKKELRDLAKAQPGDTVRVTMEQDYQLREVEAPEDFLDALSAHEQAEAYFNSLAYSYQKEYVAWIEGAKRPETRASRIEKSVSKLAEGLKLK
ncbi:YdeI/OmpD-associated family protein [Paenibacillus sp. FSL R10-2734]|uniref:YdeI/OmpD-associated family protein n=1 Tax=Paenibacillus sp. FSL R10-2734 TaxID=2954691 RepID=UPI0030DC5EB0